MEVLSRYVGQRLCCSNGAKVALVEKHKLGGICLNYGCIPTKAYLKSAKMYKDIKLCADFELKYKTAFLLIGPPFYHAKIKLLYQLTTGISFLLKKNKIDFYHGFASVLSPCEVQVDTNLLHTQKLIIATGSTAFVPPIPGAQEVYQKAFLKLVKNYYN
ncbi:FAD-dependent oxidoreductase [Areca yellow leaf disease phytoplasma]|uniref:FAD-dependent oxidoreductase n=1 Tax=Areca yellow leaf disease phytoplasma TaxID=927614 RepID=UPI0035B5345E